MTQNDGGPAFPYYDTVTGHTQEGMTLRDWFAGHVMASVMTNAEGLVEISKEDRMDLLGVAAEISYDCADAMLEERKK